MESLASGSFAWFCKLLGAAAEGIVQPCLWVRREPNNSFVSLTSRRGGVLQWGPTIHVAPLP